MLKSFWRTTSLLLLKFSSCLGGGGVVQPVSFLRSQTYFPHSTQAYEVTSLIDFFTFHTFLPPFYTTTTTNYYAFRSLVQNNSRNTQSLIYILIIIFLFAWLSQLYKHFDGEIRNEIQHQVNMVSCFSFVNNLSPCFLIGRLT